GRQSEQLPKFTSLPATQRLDVSAVIREEDALPRYTEPAIRVVRPATTTDPRIGGPAGSQIEATEGRGLEMERSWNWEHGRDMAAAPQCQARNRCGADEVTVNHSRPALRHDLPTAPHGPRQLPGMTCCKVQIGLDNTRAAVTVPCGQALIRGWQGHRHFNT